MAKRKSIAQLKRNPNICLDFDGVLAEYHGWRGVGYWGKPMPGVKIFLQRLGKANVDFVVCTTRVDKKGVRAWFKKYDLPLPTEITNKKPLAAVYIDDRSMQFKGDWDALTKQLKKFSVYWKPDRLPFKDL